MTEYRKHLGRLYRKVGTQALLLAVAIYLTVRSPGYGAGFLMACALMLVGLPVIDRFIGGYPIYRRWYILCRNELEQLDPNNRALKLIGERTSKHEAWESEAYK